MPFNPPSPDTLVEEYFTPPSPEEFVEEKSTAPGALQFPTLPETATFAESLQQPTPILSPWQGGVVRSAIPGSLQPEDLLPAVRKIGGELAVGEKGDTHPDIIERDNIPAVELDQRGFLGPNGFMDRESAATALRAPTEFEPGRLHSTDLSTLQEPDGYAKQLQKAAEAEGPQPLIRLPEPSEKPSPVAYAPIKALFGQKGVDVTKSVFDTAYRAAKSVPEFLSTEEGMLSVLASATPLGRAGVEGYFTYEMLKSLYDQAKSGITDWDKLSPSQKAERITQAVVTLGFVGLLGKAGVGTAKKLIKEPGKAFAPEVPPALMRLPGQEDVIQRPVVPEPTLAPEVARTPEQLQAQLDVAKVPAETVTTKTTPKLTPDEESEFQRIQAQQERIEEQRQKFYASEPSEWEKAVKRITPEQRDKLFQTIQSQPYGLKVQHELLKIIEGVNRQNFDAKLSQAIRSAGRSLQPINVEATVEPASNLPQQSIAKELGAEYVGDAMGRDNYSFSTGKTEKGMEMERVAVPRGSPIEVVRAAIDKQKARTAEQFGTEKPPEPTPATTPEPVTAQPEIVGMGGATAGETAPGAQIEQLTQAMENIRESKAPLGQQLKDAFKAGETLSGAKDILGRAIDGLKVSARYLVDKWKGNERIDDMLRAKGDLSKAIEERGWRLRQWELAAKRAIPNPRDQAAISKWVDAGGDRALLEQGLREAPDKFKQAYQDALNLSGDKLIAAQNVQNFFESRLQEAIDAGVLDQGIENYIHRIYSSRPNLEKQALAFNQGGLLRMNPSLAKRRAFQFDWEAEKQGYIPVQSFAKRIAAYEAALTKAIASRRFVKSVSEMKAEDGRPIVDIKGVGVPIEDPAGVYREATMIKPKRNPARSNEATLPNGNPNPDYRGDYVHRDYRALQRWKWVSSDAGGKPIFVQGDLAIHPDYVTRVDALLQPSQVRYGKYGKVLRPAMDIGSAVKQTMLDMSGFHQVQITVHGLEHGVMPWKIIQNVDLDSPNVQGLLKGGLTLGGDYHSAYREGLVGRSITSHIPGLGPMLESYHSWLFQDYIPRIKATMALHALERNRARFGGKLTEEQIYQKTANQANAAFGELNYIMLERSKTAQDMARLILLAPDFLEARGRFASQALERGGKGVPVLGGNEQRAALLLGALTMWVTARIANKIVDGQYHNEPENLFNIVYKDHAYGLRTVQGDILHFLTKPLQFWLNRLNPVYGRTALEIATGRDYYGRKRSIAQQAWDLASTVMPISLRSSRERSIWESLANGFGITARRWSDTDDAFTMAKKWKEKHGVGERGEFIYDPDKDPLRPLKIALSHGDDAGAAKEIKALIQSKKYTLKKLDDYFARYARMPFTGSIQNDKKFLATLSEDERKTVQAAKQHKQEINKLYRKSRGQITAPAERFETAGQ